jgi:uncharacterized protein YkwD
MAKLRSRGAFVALLILIILLVAFVAIGIATQGNYFHIFSKSNSALPISPANQGAPTQVAGTVSEAISPSTPASPGSSGNSNLTALSVDTPKLEQPEPAGADSGVPAISIARLEQEVHGLINETRQQNGLQPLSWDTRLNVIARSHSSDMALRNYFNHVTPEGSGVADRYRQEGYTMTIGCGENIFMCPEAKADYYRNGVLMKTEYYKQSEMADLIVRGWMNSPGHRQNILSLEWKVQAIGIAISADEKVYITEDFA